MRIFACSTVSGGLTRDGRKGGKCQSCLGWGVALSSYDWLV